LLVAFVATLHAPDTRIELTSCQWKIATEMTQPAGNGWIVTQAMAGEFEPRDAGPDLPPCIQENVLTMDIEGSISGATAVVLNRDLLFGSRLRSALDSIGLAARRVSSTEEFVQQMNALGGSCAIGIIDMNGPVDWAVLSAALRASEHWPPLLAFGPHVDAEQMRAAKAAGITRVVSNGQFNREMVRLIERYRRTR
jgi:hypothetical protein